jgi:hypothetical protein
MKNVNYLSELLLKFIVLIHYKYEKIYPNLFKFKTMIE